MRYYDLFYIQNSTLGLSLSAPLKENYAWKLIAFIPVQGILRITYRSAATIINYVPVHSDSYSLRTYPQ